MKKTLILAVLLVGCATGPNRWDQEYNAYIGMLNEQIADGKITQAQGEYLAAQKRNEIVGRRQAHMDQSMGIAGQGAAIMNSSGPHFPPAPIIIQR